MIAAARPRDVFDDPFADGGGERRPMLLVLDDGSEDAVSASSAAACGAAADERGVRVETVDRRTRPTEVARYASLLLSGTYAAEYLRLGLVED